jgi:hypothetical protein
MTNGFDVDTSPGYSAFRVEDEFYEAAEDLRSQFDAGISMSPLNGGMTPLTYAFCEDVYQCLTASAQRIFHPDLMDGFVNRVQSWAAATLQTATASTPQVRVYIGGCSRSLARDQVSQPWHYMLWLCPDGGRKRGTVKMMRDERAGDSPNSRLVSLRLKFNQLLVHRTDFLYAIETPKLSMNPSEGIVFVDGYLG